MRPHIIYLILLGLFFPFLASSIRAVEPGDYTFSTTNLIVWVPKGTQTTKNLKTVYNGTNNFDFFYIDDWASTTPLWHKSNYRSHRGTTSWYYGVESQRNYDTPGGSIGWLTSIRFHVPESGPFNLSFWQWRQTEPVPDLDNDGKPDFLADLCQVQACSATMMYDWQTVYTSYDNSSTWQKVNVDLSNYAGKDIFISFMLATLDGEKNNYEGWYIDEVKFNDKELPVGWVQTQVVHTTVGPKSRVVKLPFTFDALNLEVGTYKSEYFILGSMVESTIHVYDPNIFLDGFNRTNSDSLGKKWTESAHSTLNIYSNKVVGVGLASPAFPGLEPLIQKIWFDKTTTSNSFGGLFVCGTSNSYYQGVIGTDPQNPQKLSYASIDMVDGSGVHPLASVSTTLKSGSMTLENTGSNLFMNLNGMRVLSATYSNPAATNWTFGLISDGWKITTYKAAHEPLVLPFRDDFERSNRTDLSIHWSELMGNFSIVSNQAVCSTSNSLAVVNGIKIADISLEGKVDVSKSGSLGGLLARCDEKGSFYCAGLYNNNGAIVAAIGKCVNKNFTVLSQKPVTNPFAVVRLDTLGNKVSLYIDDLLVDEITDSDIQSLGSVGIGGLGGAILDNFNAVKE